MEDRPGAPTDRHAGALKNLTRTTILIVITLKLLLLCGVGCSSTLPAREPVRRVAPVVGIPVSAVEQPPSRSLNTEWAPSHPPKLEVPPLPPLEVRLDFKMPPRPPKLELPAVGIPVPEDPARWDLKIEIPVVAEVSITDRLRIEPTVGQMEPLRIDFPSLAWRPEGARLRPRSPYCLPGHLPLNTFMLHSEDKLPISPGLW